MTKKPQQQISAKRVLITSFFVNIGDVLINLFASSITGSVVIRAELLKGVTDLIGSGLLIIGIRRSQKKADDRHPFGFGREIYFWTFLSALMMAIVASSFSFYFGLIRILHPEPVSNIPLAISILLFATITNGYSSSLSLHRLLGKRDIIHLWDVFWQTPFVETKSALIQDVMGTSSALVGLLSLTLYLITGYAIFDGIGAMIIGVILAILASVLIHGLHDAMIGKSAPKRIEEKIVNEVLSVPNVLAVLDLRTMMVGTDRVLVNIEVNLEDHLTTDQIERLIDKIKYKVREEIPSIGHIQVELESPEG